MRQKYWLLPAFLLSFLSSPIAADPFPPDLGGTAIHFQPVSWPTEPVNALECGDSCGDWKPYTRFQNPINDPRSQDDSNGGTAPQN